MVYSFATLFVSIGCSQANKPYLCCLILLYLFGAILYRLDAMALRPAQIRFRRGRGRIAQRTLAARYGSKEAWHARLLVWRTFALRTRHLRALARRLQSYVDALVAHGAVVSDLHVVQQMLDLEWHQAMIDRDASIGQLEAQYEGSFRGNNAAPSAETSMITKQSPRM